MALQIDAAEVPARTPERPGLSMITPADRRHHARWYSGLVRGLRVTLPLVALILVAMVVIWPHLKAEDLAFRIVFSSITGSLDEDPNLLNPRYVGTDDQDRPYSITADIAKKLNSAPLSDPGSLIGLDKPKADMTMNDGTWLVLTADNGVYAQGDETLDLEGSVNLFHDTGYEFRTEEASVDLAKGIAAGDVPVEGQGPFGTLNAEGFRLLDRGNRIVFTGKSKLVLYPKEGRQ